MNNSSNHERFMRLLTPVYANLERYALFLTRNREDARDLVSETILAALEGFERLREDRAFLSFLFTIASRTYYRHRNKSRILQRMESAELEELFGSDARLDISADTHFLYKALEKLSDEMREAVILAEIFGYSHKEIAAIQGATVVSIKVRIFRAKQKLTTLLAPKSSEIATNKRIVADSL